MKARQRTHRLLALASLALAALGALPVAAELAPMDAVVCEGNRDLEIRGRFISTPGDGVVARGNCDIVIVGSRIEAGGRGVWVAGNGDVEIVDSYVSGAGVGIEISGNGDVECDSGEIHGGTRLRGTGELDNDGCEIVRGTVSWSGAAGREAPATAGPDVSVRSGAGGIVVEDGGERVTVGPGGVRVESGGETVTVDGGYVRIDSPEGTTEVSGDWRVVVDSPWAAADTGRLIVELGGEEGAEGLRLQMAGDVLFDFDSAAIRPDAARELAKLGHVIRQRAAGEITVTGHTDALGAAEYNQGLSEQRAVAVMQWLARHEGVPASMMRGRGMGSTEPVAHNTRPDGSDYPEGRALNRRVEIEFASTGAAAAGVRVGPAGVAVGGAGGEVTVGAGGVRVEAAPQQPEARAADAGERIELSELSEGCRTVCRRWRGIDDAIGACATVVLELRGYSVTGEILCAGAETPGHCALCAARLGLADEDCAAVAEQCL